METVKQFSVFLVNRPGVLAHTCEALAKSKVNIVAFTLMDSAEQGVLRVVSNDEQETRAALQKLGAQFVESDVLLIDLPNRPGALARVARELAEAKINIEYAYASTPTGNKAIAIVRTGNLTKATKVLAARPRPKRAPATARIRKGKR
jgi:hypothetical protein